MNEQLAQLFAYIDTLAEFGPQLLELGYEVGDFNETLPVIWVSGHGVETCVPAADREQLESLIDPQLHAERVEALSRVDNATSPPDLGDG